MKKEIKAIIFDVGGVLRLGNPSFEHPNVHSFVAKKLKTDLDQYFDSIDTPYAKSIEGKISEQKALKIMARNLKITPQKLKKLYLAAYKKYYTLNKELLNFSFSLRKRGYKTAILSDQWWLSKKALFSKSFYNKFNIIIVSCDIGTRKPGLKIFRLTLKKLNLPAQKTLFIDNQKWNIASAKKLGMKTILFKNNRQAIREINNITEK